LNSNAFENLFLSPNNTANESLFNKQELGKFKNLKSNDLQLLSNERNTRLLGTLNSLNHTHNFAITDNNLTSLNQNLSQSKIGTSQNSLYSLSALK
jgi:hypothetical protein